MNLISVKLIGEIVIVMTLIVSLQCGVFPTLIRQRKAVDDYKIENCYFSEKEATKQGYFAKYNLLLRPEGRMFTKYPDVRNKYTWTYTSRRSHPETNKPWENFDIKKYVSQSNGFIHFPPRTLLPGLYEVTPNPTPKGSAIKLLLKTCYFSIKTLPPIAVIDDTSFTKDFTLNAGNSLDPNLLDDRKPKLKFQWSCEQNICYSSDEILTVETESVEDMYRQIEVHLKVTSEFGTSDTVIQQVFYESSLIKINLSCKRNCLHVANVEEKTIFEVTCVENCDYLKDEDYEWSVTPLHFDYAKDTETGYVGRRFVVPANKFRPGEEYKIAVIVGDYDTTGHAITKIKFAAKPSVQHCATNPSASFTVPLSFSCAPDEKYFYELFVGDAADWMKFVESDTSRNKINFTGKILLSGYSPEVFKRTFLLPPSEGDKYTVRVSDGTDSYNTLNLKLQLMEPVVTKKTTPRAVRHKFGDRFKGPTANSISALLASNKEKRVKKGIQKFQGLIENLVISQIDNVETENVFVNFKESIIADLLKKKKEPLIKELIEVSDRLQALEEADELEESDPLIPKFTSLICSTIISKHNEKVKKSSSPEKMRNQTIEAGNTLADCLEINSKPNYEVVERVTYKIVIDEVPSPQLEIAITESYPNYVDFDTNYPSVMENLKKYTMNVINATASTAKTLALTAMLGEHGVSYVGKNSGTSVIKDKGNNLARASLTLMNCTLHPSMDFANSEHPFDVLMSVWKKDMMWWNPNTTRIATPIVNIEFWHSSCKKRMKHFKAPASVFLQVKDEINFELQLVEDSVTVPPGYQNMLDTDLNRIIRVHRVTLPKRTVLHVDFFNLSSTDAFDVVITKSRVPVIEDFADSTTITATGESSLVFANEESYHIWCYMGILPSKEIPASNVSMIRKFNMSFTMACCLVWNPEHSFWKPACNPGKQNSDKVINCECKHFSTLAGYMQNIPSYPFTVITEDLLLEFQSSYLIFITVAFTFGLYCLLLIAITFRKPDQIYFLGDNTVGQLYAYVLIVRTENFPDAGTTSNVIIKLKGSKKDSEPHVLNFPDPKMRLLQRQGEEMFILTTSGYLGRLVKIELWTDCSGPSPSWYCRDILIYDMQNRSQRYFKIKTRFHIQSGVTRLVATPAGRAQPKLKFLKQFTMCNHFHGWVLWAGEKNFPFLPKLTAVLSKILTMYAFLLILLGIPSMELKDCIDSYQYYHLEGFSVFAAFVSSLGSFVIHLGISWLFRFSNIEFSVYEKQYKSSSNVTPTCWVLFAILIVTSLSFLTIYGFWVPYYTSLIWITCSAMGMLLDVVIFENIFIMVQTYFCKFRMTYSFDEKYHIILKCLEEQRTILVQKFGALLLRPYLRHLYKPLDDLQLIKRKIIVKLRRGVIEDLEDLVMYGIYNIILYVVILVNKASLTAINTAEIVSMIEGKHTRSLPFSSIASLDQMQTYINDTLIPTLQPLAWYGNFGMNNPGMTKDFNNKVIGVARLRQHRIAANYCTIPEQMHFLNMSCWPEFALGHAETDSFGYGWAKYNSGMEFDRLNYIWRYQSESETGTLLTIGEIASYSGGGYVAFLGRTLYNSYLNLLRLYEMYWITYKTRSIFVEFLTYNANYNIFNAVRIYFEQSGTGFVYGIIDIMAVRMLYVQNEIEIMSMVVFFLFVSWVLMLMFKLSVGIWKNKKVFFRKLWLMVDLLISLLSVVCICMFLVRMKLIENHLHALEEVKHNEFVSYFNLIYLEEFLTFFAAFLVCIATVRLWRFLRFGIFFRILERTLSMALFSLLGVTTAFSLVLLAFGLTAVLMLGNEFPEFSAPSECISSLIQLALRPDGFFLMEYANHAPLIVGYVFFTIYVVLLQIMLFTYVTVIIMAYSKAKLEFSVEPDSYNLTDYIRERVDYFPKLIKQRFRRLRGGEAEIVAEGEQKKPVKPKADEFRYANCFGIPKSTMQAMRFIISCIIRNIRQTFEERQVLTEFEAIMMLEVCNQFVLKTYEDDELELFFKGHFVGERFRVVDEKRITKMADFVLMLLQKKPEKTSEEAKETDIEKSIKMIKTKISTLRTCNLLLKFSACKLDYIDEIVTSLLKGKI